MVQILEGMPSFGQSIGNSLGGGLGAGMASAAEFGQKMMLESQKQKGKKDLFGSLIGSGQDQGQSKMSFKPLDPQQEMMLAFEDPKAFNAYSSLKQSHEKQEEKSKTKENLTSTLDEMVNTLLEGNLGYTHKRLGAKGRRDTQYFDTLGTQLESIGKEMVSKGVLSAPRFAYLLSNLPAAKKTDASNAGALEAWAKELDLDIPSIGKLKPLYEKKSQSKKVKPGQKLDEATMIKLYKKTGGDKEKIKQVAKKMGYDIE